MAALTEITATYIRESVRRDDWAIAIAWLDEDAAGPGTGAGEIKISVTCDPDELKQEQEYRWLGQWKEHAKYGRQFHASSFVLKLPHGRAGIIRYLSDAGQGLRFGPARAAKCFEIWGSDAVEHFRREPIDVANALQHCGSRYSISDDTARAIAAKLQEDAALEACTLDLLDVLSGNGFPRSAPRECVRKWGNRAANVVRRDPFRLMGVVRGAGFKRCDALWLEMGLSPTRLKRQALAAWYAIARDTDGHTWFPVVQATRGVELSISGTDVNPERALRLAVRGGALSECKTDGAGGPISSNGRGTVRWVSERRRADNERELAEALAEAMRETIAWSFGD